MNLENLTLTVNTNEIEAILKKFENSELLDSMIEFYDSIWMMTYGNSSNKEIQTISQSSIAYKIALMNGQESLIQIELINIENVTYLDLGAFPEANIFPELLRYTSLKKLELWENGISVLPDDFFQLYSLESLYICDELVELSSLIENFCNLKYLNLEGNRLTKIPEQIQKLRKLELLDLSWNRIKTFSLNVSDMQNLTKIDLRHNSEKVLVESKLISECKDRNIELLY